ncbi:MAG: choice-of-anchor J domain-containing protein [bacterium]
MAIVVAISRFHRPSMIENPALREVAPQPFSNVPPRVAASIPLPPPSPNPTGTVVTANAVPPTAPQGVSSRRVLFGNGIPFAVSDLPPSPLRTELEALPLPILTDSLTRLTKMCFHVNDLNSLHVDPSGMPYYVCSFTNQPGAGALPQSPAPTKPAANIPKPDTVFAAGNLNPTPSVPGILAAVPITNPPLRHSRPGATRVLYLDFNGQVVTNTMWNNNTNFYNVARWDCRPFDTDGDTNTFSDAEQGAIIRIWERVSEDYAPFDVDVTTEPPTNWTSTTGHALITPDTDLNGNRCPHYGSGGIAYVDVFGLANYSYNSATCYSPAFVLPMGSDSDSYAETAEAAAHELGHNLGLSHDGTSTLEYYGGHGSGDISWGPIMGTGYGRNVSQWSKGEYYDANNPEDDLAIIAAKAPYRPDDHSHTPASASLLTASNGTIITSGVISSNSDIDVMAFAAGEGLISLTSFPYRCANGTYGGNLDIRARLFNSSGTLVAENNPSNATQAIIAYWAPATGKYYLTLSNSGTGTPTNNPPSGYTAYGSIGQYFVTGKVALLTGLLVESPNNGEVWYKGQTNLILWASGSNAAGNVRIGLYRDQSSYCTLTNSVTNSGAYAWIMTPPMLSSTNFKIQLSSVTQTSVWDESDSPFTIATAPTASLLFETFDAGTTIPAGWSQTNLSGTATTWKFQTGGRAGGSNPTSAYSGTHNACLYDTSTSPDVCRLLTPAITMTGCTGAVLRFQHYMQLRTSRQDYLNIWASTNSSISWFWIAGYSNSIASWTQHALTLPNPGPDYTIAFEGIAKNGNGICLDDVEVIGYPEDINTVTNNTPLAWLADNSLEPSDAGALSDTDNDGMAAWQEWIAGTSPTQFLSVLAVSNIGSIANEPVIAWPTVTGRSYSVTWTSNLMTTAFIPLVTNNTTGVYTDAVHAVDPNAFYRIGVQMDP